MDNINNNLLILNDLLMKFPEEEETEKDKDSGAGNPPPPPPQSPTQE